MTRYHLCIAVLASAVAMTSCVDDNYDLSDVDTTAKVQVNDLTIPVNIDPITLGSIFDIDNEDPDAVIKEIDGAYAVVKSGTFTSSDIKIDPVLLSGTVGGAVSSSIPTGAGGQQPSAGMVLSLPITSDNISYSYSTGSVPAEILSIDNVTARFTLSCSLRFSNLSGISEITLRNLVFEMPKGLNAVASVGSYDANTGKVTIPSCILTDGLLTVVLDCSGLDYAKAGGLLNTVDHSASLSGNVRLASGDLVIDGSKVSGRIPDQIGMSTSLNITDIDVKKFSGELCYDISGVSISDITLDDLPDVLAQNGTSVSLANPQIYLGVTNPLSRYGLKARTGLEITSHFRPEQNTADAAYSLDAPGSFTVSPDPSSSYVLSPENPVAAYPGFSNLLHVPFTSLSSVLSGNGLPQSLSILLVDPQVFPQHVVDLPLDQPFGSVNGNYEFFAPLAFNANSKVVYTETENGWNDEDVDAITIEKLVVSTTVSSDLPFSLDFKAYPVDVNGNKINNVDIEGATVPANAVDQKIEIRITGEVTHLDGIVFTATGLVPEDMKMAISSSQNINCKDIRATVSGYYLKEL